MLNVLSLSNTYANGDTLPVSKLEQGEALVIEKVTKFLECLEVILSVQELRLAYD